MSNLGGGEIFLIIIFALFLFGPKKLPELGRATGKTLREFKNALNGTEQSPSKNHSDTD